MANKRQKNAAAILTIWEASNMSDKGKKAIAEWLRQQAKNLLKDGKNYSKRFTARYMYL